MGLAAAYQALEQGFTVEILEGAPEPGGMAAHFDLGGLSTERFYHFICKSDLPTMQVLKELGISDLLRWRTTTMGLFTSGHLYPWGNPIALLTFPKISILSRLRYALFAFVCTRRERWDAIEKEGARTWIIRWCGQEVYDRLWAPLFHLKFFEYSENISAAWIWTRIKRIGRSRKSILQEELGYLEGGSETLIKAFSEAIERLGGTIHLNSPATKVVTEGGRVAGVETPLGFRPADYVICTVPTPLVAGLVPDLPESLKLEYNRIHNIGICCLVFKLKRSVTPHFWVNISEHDIEIPGVIEFSNLRPIPGAAVVYIPYYMPVNHPKFSAPDESLLTESFGYLQRLNPELQASDILASHVARLRYAQPICEPGFASHIPPIQTPIAGLQIADTCFYYPEDRGISESVRLGREMAVRIGHQQTTSEAL
jgi:protoporphyrinogen oxidase